MTGPRYDGVVPPCDSGSALSKISDRFAQKEGTFWNSTLTISGFDKVRETAFRPWAPNTIPRRFCSAIVRISDGSQHPIHYSIAEDTGLLGVTWGVEWCVVGLDRNWAYSPPARWRGPERGVRFAAECPGAFYFSFVLETFRSPAYSSAGQIRVAWGCHVATSISGRP